MVTMTVHSSVLLDERGIGRRDWAGSCPSCHYVLPPIEECAPIFFETGSVLCRNCANSMNLWEAALGYARALEGPWGLTSLGATESRISICMETDKYYEIDLAEHGIPLGSKVLSVTYNSIWKETGSVFPLEAHGNSPSRTYKDNTLRLICRPLGEGALPRGGEVAIGVTWVRTENSVAWPYLVVAIESLAERDYSPALVFSQSAVEISMMPVIARRLERHASIESVRDFMSGNLNYSHACNIVLPYLCGELNIPKMPDAIRGALNRLRKRRNDIIHKGVRSKTIPYEEAIAGVLAARFGYEYMRWVEPKLLAV